MRDYLVIDDVSKFPDTGFFAGYKFFPEREAKGHKPHLVVIGHKTGTNDIEVVDLEAFDTQEEAFAWRTQALARWNRN